MQQSKGRDGLIALLAGLGLAAMIAAYFSPIWWVALTAPNYPKDAFPQGIRIHFHFNGVYNGCSVAGSGSRRQDEVIQQDLDEQVERYNPITDAGKDVNVGAAGLDCVHEMNTINHYVGMFPIATGAPVEKPLAKFFFAFFATMMAAFAMTKKKLRLAVLGIGFAAPAAWMLVDQYALGHLAGHVKEYMEETGTFFREPEKIRAWADNVYSISQMVIIGLIVVMAAVMAGVAKIRGFQLLLALVPALLPVYFVVTYAGWLWFFGHNLHPWGAFAVHQVVVAVQHREQRVVPVSAEVVS